LRAWGVIDAEEEVASLVPQGYHNEQRTFRHATFLLA
jgi:hypothetical protein